MINKQIPIRVSAFLAISYTAFSLLQITSYIKIYPDGTIWDSVSGTILFAAILFPASYTGAKLVPDRISVLSRFFGGSDANRSGLLPTFYTGVIFAVVAFVLNAVLSTLLGWIWVEPTAQEYVLQFNLVEKIGASISAGIWEETLFRLFLISAIMLVIKNKIASALSSNVLFTLMHLIFQSPPYNASALTIVFVIGLIYTKCYLDHGLEAAIICHAGMNLLAMTLGVLI